VVIISAQSDTNPDLGLSGNEKRTQMTTKTQTITSCPPTIKIPFVVKPSIKTRGPMLAPITYMKVVDINAIIMIDKSAHKCMLLNDE
jgi:hypothetical protein